MESFFSLIVNGDWNESTMVPFLGFKVAACVGNPVTIPTAPGLAKGPPIREIELLACKSSAENF